MRDMYFQLDEQINLDQNKKNENTDYFYENDQQQPFLSTDVYQGSEQISPSSHSEVIYNQQDKQVKQIFSLQELEEEQFDKKRLNPSTRRFDLIKKVIVKENGQKKFKQLEQDQIIIREVKEQKSQEKRKYKKRTREEKINEKAQKKRKANAVEKKNTCDFKNSPKQTEQKFQLFFNENLYILNQLIYAQEYQNIVDQQEIIDIQKFFLQGQIKQQKLYLISLKYRHFKTLSESDLFYVKKEIQDPSNAQIEKTKEERSYLRKVFEQQTQWIFEIFNIEQQDDIIIDSAKITSYIDFLLSSSNEYQQYIQMVQKINAVTHIFRILLKRFLHNSFQFEILEKTKIENKKSYILFTSYLRQNLLTVSSHEFIGDYLEKQ